MNQSPEQPIFALDEALSKRAYEIHGGLSEAYHRAVDAHATEAARRRLLPKAEREALEPQEPQPTAPPWHDAVAAAHAELYPQEGGK